MNIWDVIIPTAAAAISGIFGHIMGKKKATAETDGVIIDNASKVIALWEKLSEKHEERIKALEDEVFKQHSTINQMKTQYDELTIKYEMERAHRMQAEQQIRELQNNDNR